METLSPNPMNQLPGVGPQVVFANSQEEQKSAFDFWGILNRRKWIVFLGLCTGLGLGTLVHYQTPPVYRSEAQVRIEPKSRPAMRVTQTELMVPDVETVPTRHDRIIPKPVTIQSCFDSNNLYRLGSFEDMSREDTIKYVLENLEVEPDKEDAFNYKLEFHTYDPADAQVVLANIVATYQKSLEERYRKESDQFVDLLRDVRTQFAQDYQDVLRRMEELRELDTAPALDNHGRDIHMINIALLNEQLKESQAKLNEKIAARDRVFAAIESSEEEMKDQVWNLEQKGLLKINDLIERDIAGKKTKDLAETERILTGLKLDYQEQSARLGIGHITMKALRDRIDFFEGELAKKQRELETDALTEGDLNPETMLRRFVISVEDEINDLEKEIGKYVTEYQGHLRKAESLAKIRKKREDLERERANVESLLNTANNKIVEIDPTGELDKVGKREGFHFVPLQDATFGDRKWPILPVLLGIGGLLGCIGGFGLGCLVELADKTFHNPDDVMKQLQLPLIGHVPVISQSKRYLVEDSLIEPIICTYHRPKSQTSEAFRAVRTALFFNTQGKQHSVIQVTSPTPGDGKSTLAANLAVCIAQSGKRVLLVDGDMRRPRQHSTFGIKSSEGFATVLSGQSFWRDVVYEVEEIEGLALMPCGAKPNNPSELSTSPQVKELIEQMREEYDFVIIDTPPILAVTDPSPIAARVDGVVLCLRIKKNVKVSAERSTDVLRNLGASIVGVVVNGVGQQTGYGSQYTYGAYRAGYSYNGYGYGYGYGYGAGKYYEDDKANNRQPRRIEAAAAPVPQPAGQPDDTDLFENL